MNQKVMSETPLEQSGKEPGRKMIEDGLEIIGKESSKYNQDHSRKLAANLDVEGKSANDLIQMRGDLDKYLIMMEDDLRNVGLAKRSLKSIVQKAVIKNSPEYFKDKKDLERLDAFLGDCKEVIVEMRRAIAKVERAMLPFEQMKDEVEEDLPENSISPQTIQDRLGRLQYDREILTNNFNANKDKKGLTRYDMVQNMAMFAAQAAVIRRRIASEKKHVVKLLTKAKNNPNQEGDPVAVGRDYQLHVREIETLYGVIVQEATKAQNEIARVEGLVEALDKESEKLMDDLTEFRENRYNAGQDFQKQSQKPRNTEKEIQAFDKARLEYQNLQEQERLREAELRNSVAEMRKQCHELQRELGSKVPKGQTDFLTQLTAIDEQLQLGVKELEK